MDTAVKIVVDRRSVVGASCTKCTAAPMVASVKTAEAPMVAVVEIAAVAVVAEVEGISMIT